ncbi:tRNA-2-methylthio-N(6)-dimethylallyladenosine synthase [subsurface metagenome]
MEQLCDKLLADKLNINWECNTRVDLVSESLLAKMKKAGCNSIKVGIESGSERILGKMNKSITHEQVRNAAKIFRKVGIHWTGYFMMGVPGETAEEIYQTLNLMYEIQPDFASISVYEPFPGTPMFDEGLEKKLVTSNMSLEDFYTTLPNHYYKANSRRQVETIGEEEFIALAEEMKRKFHIYNKSFKRLLHRGKSRINLYVSQPMLLCSDLKKYLSWR